MASHARNQPDATTQSPTTSHTTHNKQRIQTVCVIGAGVAGICAVKALREHQLDVTCYEQLSQLGGTWNYSDSQHSYTSMYTNLICNTKPHIAQHSDFTWHSDVEFPTRESFLQYQREYAQHFGSDQHIQYNTEVLNVRRLSQAEANMRHSVHNAHRQYVVTSRRRTQPYNARQHYEKELVGLDVVTKATSKAAASHTAAADADHELKQDEHKQSPHTDHETANDSPTEQHYFDAVVIANGHFTKPLIPNITDLPNLHHSRTHVIHSHSYRRSSDYAGQRVLVVGGSHSALDIANEIALYNDKQTTSVTISMKQTEHHLKIYNWVVGSIASKRPERECPLKTIPTVHPISHVDASGAVHFEGSDAAAQGEVYDSIILCTGYHYVCPFLDPELLEASELHYKMVFPTHTPDGTLSFVGNPYRSEVQAQWVAAVLLGKLQLPSTAEMQKYVANALNDERFKSSEHVGAAHAHKYTSQPDYVRDLIAELDKDATRQHQYIFLEMSLSRRERKPGDPTFAELYPNADSLSFAEATTRPLAAAAAKPLPSGQSVKPVKVETTCSQESKQEHKSPGTSPLRFY